MKVKVYTEDSPELNELSDIARGLPMQLNGAPLMNHKRHLKRFAFFPKVAEDLDGGYNVNIIWLTSYERVEVYYGEWMHYTNYVK